MDRREICKSALATGVSVLTSGVASRPLADSAVPAAPMTKVAYHLSDIDKVMFVLGNIYNHIDGMGGPDKIRISLVVHGPPLRSFRAATNNSAITKGTKRLKEAGVELYACIHTLQGMNMTLADLLPGFVMAERGGVVKLAELQGQGWAYLRP